jgi:hypothetical protein
MGLEFVEAFNQVGLHGGETEDANDKLSCDGCWGAAELGKPECGHRHEKHSCSGLLCFRECKVYQPASTDVRVGAKAMIEDVVIGTASVL